MKSKNDFGKSRLLTPDSKWTVLGHFAKVHHDHIWNETYGSWSRMKRNGRFMRWLQHK